MLIKSKISKTILTVLTTAALLTAAGCKQNTNSKETDEPSQPEVTPETPSSPEKENSSQNEDEIPAPVTGFYVNPAYTYTTFQNAGKGTEALFIVDSWQGAWVGINTDDQTAHFVTMTDNFHGVAFGQLPTNAKKDSYYDFSKVSQMSFYIKSSDDTYNNETITGIDYSKMNIFIQYSDGTAQTTLPLSGFLSAAEDGWKKAVITSATFSSKKISTVFAIGIVDSGRNIDGDILVKGISFTDANGNETDITEHVTFAAVEETPSTSPAGYNSFFGNKAYTSGRWETLSYSNKPDFIIDSWEGSWTGVNNDSGVATLVVTDGNWHGGTFAGMPTNTVAGSWYDFSNVSKMRFWVRSSAIKAADIKFFIQYLDAAQTEVFLSSYGVSDITDWVQVTIPKSAFNSKKVTTAVALGAAKDKCSVKDTIFVAGLEFLDSAGNEIPRSEMTAHISYKTAVTGDGADTAAVSVNSTKNRTQNAVTGAYVYTAADPDNASSFTTIVWSDEFNGSKVDTENNWNYEVGTGDWGWGNNEQEYYTKGDNAGVADGALNICAKSDLTSTRMKTDGKVNFLYGKIEARMKFDEGNGSWPAFWMLGANLSEGISWPYCGEIDIMEHANSNTTIDSTFHFNYTGSNPALTGSNHGSYGTLSGDYYGNTPTADVTQWHTYKCVWTRSKITMFIDDLETITMNIGGSTDGTDAFNKPFYILLNFAMGGQYVSNTDTSTFTNLPWNMYVDYVRVYQ